MYVANLKTQAFKSFAIAKTDQEEQPKFDKEFISEYRLGL